MTFNRIKVGIINVATNREKEYEILDIMRERGIDIIGMAETRIAGREIVKILEMGTC